MQECAYHPVWMLELKKSSHTYRRSIVDQRNVAEANTSSAVRGRVPRTKKRKKRDGDRLSSPPRRTSKQKTGYWVVQERLPFRCAVKRRPEAKAPPAKSINQSKNYSCGHGWLAIGARTIVRKTTDVLCRMLAGHTPPGRTVSACGGKPPDGLHFCQKSLVLSKSIACAGGGSSNIHPPSVEQKGCDSHRGLFLSGCGGI
jgi:hypothetical protein